MCSSKTVVGSSWAALLWNHLRALDTDMATLESLCVCVRVFVGRKVSKLFYVISVHEGYQIAVCLVSWNG